MTNVLVKNRCPRCGVKEGELHKYPCIMEICPYCDCLLLDCECIDSINKDIEKHKSERIPYVKIPLICRICGKINPDFFMVSDKEWDKYVVPPLKEEILCLDCFKKMVKLFPDGWRQNGNGKTVSKWMETKWGLIWIE